MKEMKIDDVKVEKEKKAQEPAVHEKAAEKLKQAARALNETDGNLEATFAAIREKQLLKDLEVLRAECAGLKAQRDRMNNQITNLANEINDSNRECLGLRKTIAEMSREHEAEVADLRDKLQEGQEVIDLKKTISKMKQAHDAEVQDLKDQLGEAKAVISAADKERALAIAEKNDYADALDNDSVAFEEILGLAILLERGAKSMHEVSKMIQAKTEGRV